VKYPLIALLTDFGEDDFFAASLKAVIVRINPSARIIDITHRLPSFDVMAAAFILFSCYKYFPPGAIFLAVVDPGVGSSRRILLAETKKYFFIAPDNGVLSLVLEEEAVVGLREITNKKYFLPETSRTFEGRDKMAPSAAWLSRGISCEEFGPEAAGCKKLKIQRTKIRRNEIIGHILYADKFGNLITSIPGKMLGLLRQEKGKRDFSLLSRGREVASYKESYSSAKKGKLLFLIGSLGLIEIACREASALKKLKVRIGDEVKIALKSQNSE
jgi:hypothetical protein